MSRRGNPYDNAKMESLMETLKVEGVYPMAFETAEDVAERLPSFYRDVQRPAPPLSAWLFSPNPYEELHAWLPVKDAA